MAANNNKSLNSEPDTLVDFDEDEDPYYNFVTPNTFRESHSDSSDSGDCNILDKEHFSMDFLADVDPASSALTSSSSPHGKTLIRQFVMDTTPTLTKITPLSPPSESKSLTPNSSSNFTLNIDFSDHSSEEEEFLIDAVKTAQKSYRVRKSVGNPAKNETEDSTYIPNDHPPPADDLVRCATPTNEVRPMKLFVNKMSLSNNKKRLSLLKENEHEATLSTELDTEPKTLPPRPKDHKPKKTDRFHKADKEEIISLQLNSKAQRTNQQTAWGIKILREWLESEDMSTDFEELSTSELGELFTKFFASVRQQDGKKYSRTSLLCLRAALHRHLTGPPYNKQLNLNTDGEFMAANSVLKGILRDDKKNAQDTSIKHPPISNSDNGLMYSSGVLTDQNPKGLLYKTFFEIALHFGRRGREGLKELQKDQIIFLFDDNNVEYCTLSFNPSEKNHQGLACHESEHSQQMFSTGGDDCPLKSLKKYLTKLHPDGKSFFQRPRMKGYINSEIWYSKSALGLNKIGNLMSDISAEANHSVRATCITQLRHGGVHISDIKTVTGHKNVASLEAYSRTSDKTRRQMSHKLSRALGKNVPDEETEEKVVEIPKRAQNKSENHLPPPEKPLTPKKRMRSILLPVASSSHSSKSTPPSSPVQLVKPTPRKKIKEPEESQENQDTKSSPEGAYAVDLTKKSPLKEERKELETRKIVRKLEFVPQQSSSKNESEEKIVIPKPRSNSGQTIIIEQGNVIHIHYH